MKKCIIVGYRLIDDQNKSFIFDIIFFSSVNYIKRFSINIISKITNFVNKLYKMNNYDHQKFNIGWTNKCYNQTGSILSPKLGRITIRFLHTDILG